MNASRPTNLFIYSYHQCLFIILINTTLFAFFFFQNWFWDIYIADKAVCSAKYLQWIWNSSNKQKSIFSALSYGNSRMSEMKSCTCWCFKLHWLYTVHVYFQKEFGLSSKEKLENLIKTETFLSLPQVSWNIFFKFICLSLEALNSLSFKYTLPISQNPTNANIWPAFGISVFQFSIFSIYLFAGKLKSLRGI